MKEIFNDLEGLRYALNEGSVIKDKLQIRNEGYAEGYKEGLEESITEIATKLIEVEIDNDIIANATGLAADKIDELRNAITKGVKL